MKIWLVFRICIFPEDWNVCIVSDIANTIYYFVTLFLLINFSKTIDKYSLVKCLKDIKQFRDRLGLLDV